MLHNSNFKKLLLLAFVLVLFGCEAKAPTHDEPLPKPEEIEKTEEVEITEEDSHDVKWIVVEYRDTAVDINNPDFEYQDTSKSSFVRGGWYDSDDQYFIIKLGEKYYHYCNLPSDIWAGFKSANSFGSYYNSSIKNKFSCEGTAVPEY